MTKLTQAGCLAVSLVAFGMLTTVWWALLAGGVLAAVLLELEDSRRRD